MCEIIVNQAGYLTTGVKRAIVADKLQATEFCLIDKQNSVVYKGKLIYKGYDREAGDNVTLIDFSDFIQEGCFDICIDGIQRKEIGIGKDVYDKTFNDIIRAFYYLRCGMELKEEHAGKFTHEKCHCSKAMLWDDHDVLVEATGGWHDAGEGCSSAFSFAGINCCYS